MPYTETHSQPETKREVITLTEKQLYDHFLELVANITEPEIDAFITQLPKVIQDVFQEEIKETNNSDDIRRKYRGIIAMQLLSSEELALLSSYAAKVKHAPGMHEQLGSALYWHSMIQQFSAPAAA